MSCILSREGETPRVSGFFFKAMIQAVLLFGAETWVVTPCMGKALGGFQTQVERRLTGQIPWRTPDGTWKYTLAAAAREAAVLLQYWVTRVTFGPARCKRGNLARARARGAGSPWTAQTLLLAPVRGLRNSATMTVEQGGGTHLDLRSEDPGV